MKRIPVILSSLLLVPLVFLSPAAGASTGVHDQAKFFSPDSVAQAEQVIRQINQKHQKDVLIETYPGIPQEKQAQYQQMGKNRFYSDWAYQIGKQRGVDGVVILITRDPSHLQVKAGDLTEKTLFKPADIDQLDALLATEFKQKRYDDGLVQGVQLIQQHMDANAPAGSGGAAAPPVTSSPPRSSTPPFSFPTSTRSTGFGLGGIACIIIAVVLFIILIRGIFGRSGGGGGFGRPGGMYPPQGGYPQGGGGYPQQGGYGQPGYGGGGGSGGFGKGLLGGLLGGAIGGYAADKWLGHGQQPGSTGNVPPAGGAGGADFGSGTDTSYSGGGADFGTPDSSGGGGADFSSGGGGADFGGSSDSGGGGGSDFGGGGGGGGDAGGGGSDF